MAGGSAAHRYNLRNREIDPESGISIWFGASVQQSQLTAAERGFAAGADVELGQNARDVGIHGAGAEKEPLRDFPIGSPLGDEAKHIQLPVGQDAGACCTCLPLPAAPTWHGDGRGHLDSIVKPELPAFRAQGPEASLAQARASGCRRTVIVDAGRWKNRGADLVRQGVDGPYERSGR